MARFGPVWRVLMSHLVLFGFVFPFERHAVPAEVIEELTASLVKEAGEQPGEQPICNGTLLSRIQYLPDITAGGLIDARTTDRSKIKPAEIEEWTKASLRYRNQVSRCRKLGKRIAPETDGNQIGQRS
jgi:hypothetical protein